MRSLFYLAALLILAAGIDCAALDGIAVTTHSETGQPRSLHSPNWGNIVRHDIRGGAVAKSTPIYTGGDAGFACIGPLGNEVAFLRRDGAIAVVSINGGDARVVCKRGGSRDKDGNLPGVLLHIAWPYGENGRWVYYLDDPDSGCNGRHLKRVDIQTGETQSVVMFNMLVNGFGLSLYATPQSGTFACRPTARKHICYNMAEGTGDLWNAVSFDDACGVSVSPDGAFFTANDAAHSTCSLVDTNGNKHAAFSVNQYDKTKAKLKCMWQHFRWSVNAMNWIMATQGEVHQNQDMQYTDAVLYNWVERRQLPITANKPGQFDLAGGFWQAGEPIDLALGLHIGKAPLTVQFSPPAAGPLKWNYGDGSAGADSKHTFTRAGTFTAAATDGRTTWRGRVTARPAKAPQVRRAFILSRDAFYIAFDEQVQVADKQKVTFASGAPVRDVLLDPNRREITVLGELREGDELLLDGITDKGQQPRTPEPARVPVRGQPWPSKRDGAIFIWQNSKAANAIDWPRREGPRLCSFQTCPQGAARLTPYGRMA